MTKKYWLLIISLIPLIWIAGFFVFVYVLSGLKADNFPDRSVDAIIVLTGGADRINTGLDMLSEGHSQYLFITGANEGVKTQDLLDIWSKDQQTPKNEPCCIILGYEAKNTKQNAVEAKAWISDNNIQSIFLVTAYYHLPRAQLEFSKSMDNIEIIPYPVGYFGQNELGINGWILLFSEYNKNLLGLTTSIFQRL